MSKTAPSIRALARELDRSESAVRAWKQNPAWNFTAPYPVDEIRAWAIANLTGSNNAGGSDIAASVVSMNPHRRAQINVLVERAKKLRLERRQAEGALLRRDAVERGQVQRVLAVRTALEGLARDVVSGLSGLTADQRRAVATRIDASVRAICERFAGDSGQGRTDKP